MNSTATKSLRWRGRQIETVEQLVDALWGIVDRKNPDEVQHFLELYTNAVGKNMAEKYIGYCLGYLSKKNMLAGLALFNVKHPILGDAKEAKRKSSARQAVLLGREIAKESPFGRKVVPRNEKQS